MSGRHWTVEIAEMITFFGTIFNPLAVADVANGQKPEIELFHLCNSDEAHQRVMEVVEQGSTGRNYGRKLVFWQTNGHLVMDRPFERVCAALVVFNNGGPYPIRYTFSVAGDYIQTKVSIFAH